jgi:cytidylate kinase
VEEQIRSMHVSNKVSEVAAVSAVRKFLVQQQQIIGKEKGIVMDGRDIGTVVFPHAELKLFITADMDTRVQRRLLELQSNDIQVSEDDIRNNLIKRDHEETTRADSPLIKAADAIVIDNTNLTLAEQFQIALNLAEKIILCLIFKTR